MVEASIQGLGRPDTAALPARSRARALLRLAIVLPAAALPGLFVLRWGGVPLAAAVGATCQLVLGIWLAEAVWPEARRATLALRVALGVAAFWIGGLLAVPPANRDLTPRGAAVAGLVAVLAYVVVVVACAQSARVAPYALPAGLAAAWLAVAGITSVAGPTAVPPHTSLPLATAAARLGGPSGSEAGTGLAIL